MKRLLLLIFTSIAVPATNSFTLSFFIQQQQHQHHHQHQHQHQHQNQRSPVTKLYAADEEDNDENEAPTKSRSKLDTQILEKSQTHFASNLLYTYQLVNHKPLGCTAEESLVKGENGEKFIFISKLVPGGFAATVGLEVGDLVVGASGAFDSVEDIFGEGLDRLRSLIAGRPEDKELTLKIIRQTDVMQQHESALVDLCILPEGQLYGRDKAIETCIETMYKSNYEIDDVDGVEGGCGDEDMECMLDTITDLWNDDLSFGMEGGDDGEEEKKKKEEEELKSKKKKPAPWNSRSSGSGTYVRINGAMVNIDE